LLTLKII